MPESHGSPSGLEYKKAARPVSDRPTVTMVATGNAGSEGMEHGDAIHAGRFESFPCILKETAMETSTLSVGEVAEILRCTQRHVRGLIRDGKLRAAEISRASSKRPRYRITRQAVDRFLAASAAPAPQPLWVPRGMVYAPVSQA